MSLRLAALVAAAALAAMACRPAGSGAVHEADPSQTWLIYGDDDRVEPHQVTDPSLLAAADATVGVFDNGWITPNGDGTWTVDTTESVGEAYRLCSDEPYNDQPSSAFCSGFLVGSDLVATAGHCIDAASCADTTFAFGFRMNPDGTVRGVLPNDDVYPCAGIVERVDTNTDDWAIVRLERPVVGHTPLKVRTAGVVPDGTPLVLIGHPMGIPTKIAGGAQVKTNTHANYFEANVDAYGGNSGSAVFNADTHEVEGILVRGNPDFVRRRACFVSNTCDDETGCSGTFEEISRSTRFADLLASSVTVRAPGEECWENGDTRAGGVVDFACGPAADPRGSLHLATRAGENADKATLDRRDWSAGDGCDTSPIGDAVGHVRRIDYTWYVQSDDAFTFAAPSVKLLIDTSDANGTSAERHEDEGDKILVYEPYLQHGAMMAEDVWLDEAITDVEGRWWLVDLTPGGSAGLGPIAPHTDLRTLAEWSDAFLAAGLGAGTIASLQVGVGSFNQGLLSWVDTLSYASTATQGLDVVFASPTAACADSGDTQSAKVLHATARFLDRGVATSPTDAFVRLRADDVRGDDVAAKNDALATISADLLATVRPGPKTGRPGSAPGLQRVWSRRVEALRRHGEGEDALLFGDAARAYHRMLDRALEATAP